MFSDTFDDVYKFQRVQMSARQIKTLDVESHKQSKVQFSH